MATTENNKYKNTVVIKVKEDFNPVRNREGKDSKVIGRILYKKGSTHAVHKSVVPKLVEKGLKHDVVDINFTDIEKKAKDKLRKSRESKK